jgi:hypothetical protein
MELGANRRKTSGANQSAEKLRQGTSGAQGPAGKEKKDFFAALKALRHPKASFKNRVKPTIHWVRLRGPEGPLFHRSLQTAACTENVRHTESGYVLVSVPSTRRWLALG